MTRLILFLQEEVCGEFFRSKADLKAQGCAMACVSKVRLCIVSKQASCINSISLIMEKGK
ncbi:hypothetical protein A7K73_01975 [Candidatus Methylacidiphilum fumarolicum]|nr:hypothetical protein A7K73_01975 [Candidatus Methylacidiphilum fumarolicum]TFE72686.1 hypothetical protein A7K72_07895 [Candidatus Methylacidiphilum fumarolicum]TFE77554.1 hypothetical protein A7D33_04045 [Candidatus Methylacidiphilum fumarolicum]